MASPEIAIRTEPPDVTSKARLAAGSDKHEIENICEQYEQEADCSPDADTGDNKIIQIQFLVLSIEPEDENFAKMLLENRDLSLRYTCPPFSRREVVLDACKLKRAPLETGYFDACYRCTKEVFDDIMCKYRPEIRLSIDTPQYVARGNYPFRRAYAESQAKVILGDWGYKFRTVTPISLMEEAECKVVAKAYVEIIVNDFKGGTKKTENIPYRPNIEICNVVPGKKFMKLASETNFKITTEAQNTSSAYQPNRVILRREHRLLFLDALFDVRQRILISMAKLLNSVADGPPLEILCDDDLYEEGEQGWSEPSDKCWWTALEEALSEGPIFEEADEACACVNGAGGDAPYPEGATTEEIEYIKAQGDMAATKLNRINQYFFGFYNCILNLIRSRALHSRSHCIYKSIRSVLDIAEQVYRQLGPKLPTYQKGPLYVRDPDRFFLEHLEVFVGMLGTATVMSTTSFNCSTQNVQYPTDHKVILNNLKFAGVFRQALERLLESPPKAIATKQHLLQRFRHPAHEVMMLPMMQSLIDMKSLMEAYCLNNIPLFAEEDLQEVEELLIFFQLVLSVLSREVVACWIQDGMAKRYEILQEDFPHLIAYFPDPNDDPSNPEHPPPGELKRNRADAPRRLRDFVAYTEQRSAFIQPLADMAARLSSAGPKDDIVPVEDDASPEDKVHTRHRMTTSGEIFSTLPGFEKLAKQIGLDLDRPKLEEKEEAYEWEINAECPSPPRQKVDFFGKLNASPQDQAKEELLKKKNLDERELQAKTASRVLQHPMATVGATIDVLRSFPSPLLNRASAAVEQFPRNVPGIYDKNAEFSEARTDKQTTLDTKIRRNMDPEKTQMGDECTEPRVVKARRKPKDRTSGADGC